ncbi:MAG: M48 family metalloprotease [Firmicutes bacterium]|nr:M48 family metalloprotease [Bacillota bacterium]
MDERAFRAHRSTGTRPCKGTAGLRRRRDGPRLATVGLRRAAAALLVVLGCLAWPGRPAQAALIGEAQEVRIGRQAAAELEQQYPLSPDAGLRARLTAIGERIAARSARPGLPYTFKVLRVREVNAISLPGGFIYATEGLMRFVESDDELAFVLGHEIGHVAARHHVQLLERHFFLALVAQLLFGGDPTAAQVAAIVRFFVQRGFSREFEFEADRLAVAYTHRAGFDASAGLGFLRRLRVAEGRDPSQFEVLFRTHPGLTDRIDRVRHELRQLGYDVGATGHPRHAPGRRPARRPAAPRGQVPRPVAA